MPEDELKNPYFKKGYIRTDKMALRYITGMIDNDYEQLYNKDIGMEMMLSYLSLGIYMLLDLLKKPFQYKIIKISRSVTDCRKDYCSNHSWTYFVKFHW